jgi:hypothetical protein
MHVKFCFIGDLKGYLKMQIRDWFVRKLGVGAGDIIFVSTDQGPYR